MSEFTPLCLQRLSTGSVYKLVFLGLMAAMAPLGLLMGLMAWIGFDTVHWQGVPVSGPGAVVVGLLAGLWVALAFTAVMGSLMALGLWLYARFKPLNLLIRSADEGGAAP
jgi:hypothetical protein